MLPDRDPPDEPAPAPTLAEVYDAHVERVWRTLRALGVDAARIDDAVQDVFLVVHRRLAEFEARSSLSTWLYGIARRVAASYRRRRDPRPVVPDLAPPVETPFDATQRREAAALVLGALDELDDDKREVFALIELEQLSAPTVAEMLGIPLNTVYSRLRLARQRFEIALARRLQQESP
jgi:RNA polymerase sigma-70 factor (ECF subfamily)